MPLSLLVVVVVVVVVELSVAAVAANVGAIEDFALGRSWVDSWGWRASHRCVALLVAEADVAGSSLGIGLDQNWGGSDSLDAGC